MPPSMQKSDCTTSVRERVLAIERGHNISENSIIRARYVPDVRGVNRYKHFHVVNTTMKNPRQEKTIHKEAAITDLPQLTQTTRNGAHHNFTIETDDNGVEKGKRNKKSILPQLGSPNSSTKTTQKEKSIGDHLAQQAKSALTSSESQSSSTTARSTLFARKHDRLASIHLQTPNTLRTFASFGTTKDVSDNISQSDEITNNDNPANNDNPTDKENPTNNEISLPEKIQQPSTTGSEPRAMKHQEDVDQLLTKNRVETATQTLDDSTTASTHIMPIECYGEGRSTQTDSYPIVVNRPQCMSNELVVNMEDVEEREALYQVIENALSETIDRYSRHRTNQIIANSARKQEQIWRDVKDFIANQLVPQSIHLANKSRSRDRTAVEIVANLKSFP